MASDQAEDEDDEAFMRRIVFPEEDRRRFTSRPWGGEFRWFRSANVVPLEKFRRLNRKRDDGCC
jgi:hypothetical protein